MTNSNEIQSDVVDQVNEEIQHGSTELKNNPNRTEQQHIESVVHQTVFNQQPQETTTSIREKALGMAIHRLGMNASTEQVVREAEKFEAYLGGAE